MLGIGGTLRSGTCLTTPLWCFQVTKVDQEKDHAETDYKPMNDQDEFDHKLYSRATYADAPVLLQLVGRKYEDEKVFEAWNSYRKRLEYL
jgi:amidase